MPSPVFTRPAAPAAVPRPVRILLVEDSPDDAELIVCALLEEGCQFLCERLCSVADLRAALARQDWDIVLADYHLPAFSAAEVVELVRADPRDIPVIVVSGHIGEEAAVTLLKNGASDFVPKANLARLAPAVRRELREARGRRDRREAIRALAEQERFLRDITSALCEGIAVLDAAGRVLFMNPEAERLLGWSEAELLGLPIHDIVHRHSDGSFDPTQRCPMHALKRDGERCLVEDELFLCKDGSLLPVSYVASRITGSDGATRFIKAFQDRSELKLAELERQASRRQLRELSAFLQRVREEERTHVARELHDELGQLLTGLRMDVEWLQRHLPDDDGPIIRKARAMTGLIDSSLRTVRRISTDLRPAVLDDFGLEAAVEWLVDSFRTRNRIACDLEIDLDGVALDEPVATAVFRLVQESLTNVSRHARARRVEIVLKVVDGVLKLVVGDDGIGFPVDALRTRSFGILGMRERVFALNGEFRVDSRPGAGTIITVDIPWVSNGTGYDRS